MEPIVSNYRNFMTFPISGEDYSIMFADKGKGVPTKIGILPADLDGERVASLLNIFEKIYQLGTEKGKKLGKKELAAYFRQNCLNFENVEVEE